MSDLDCGTCIVCCRWGNDIAIRPVLTSEEVKRFKCVSSQMGGFVLAATEEGNCIYVGPNGCTIYKDRPRQCRLFDCRQLYSEIKHAPFIKVILQGAAKS